MCMTHGVYVGPLKHLQGKTALLRPLPPGQVLAQFDDTKASREPVVLATKPELIWAMSLGFGWHEFAASDFEDSARDCLAVQYSDSMSCRLCDLTWDMSDPSPPPCQRYDEREFPIQLSRREGP